MSYYFGCLIFAFMNINLYLQSNPTLTPCYKPFRTNPRGKISPSTCLPVYNGREHFRSDTVVKHLKKCLDDIITLPLATGQESDSDIESSPAKIMHPPWGSS